jgi:carboxymethylenebutenolidase
MAEIALPYFVTLPRNPSDRGVVVAHEGLGLTTQILRFAERLAGEGYMVAAPDFFFRTGGPRDEDWWTSINAIAEEELLDDLSAAISALRGLGATTVGVTGFCLGGRISYRAAKWADDLGVDAAVSFYGDYAAELGELHCPAILIFAGKDEYVSTESVAAAKAYHGDIVHVYPDNGHAFMRDGDPSYEPEAAADAWNRLLAFFGEHLTTREVLL